MLPVFAEVERSVAKLHLDPVAIAQPAVNGAFPTGGFIANGEMGVVSRVWLAGV